MQRLEQVDSDVPVDLFVHYQVNAYLLEWIATQPLKREWFFEERNGNARLMAPLTGRLRCRSWRVFRRTCVAGGVHFCANRCASVMLKSRGGLKNWACRREWTPRET